MEKTKKKVNFRLWDNVVKTDGFRLFTDFDDVTEYIKKNIVKTTTKHYTMCDKDGNEVLVFSITPDGAEVFPQKRSNIEENKQQLLLPAGLS